MKYYEEDFLSYKLHMIKTNKFKTVNVKIVENCVWYLKGEILNA